MISDTHGLVRPEALAALQGSTHILHAGDIGDPEVLEQLRIIAPVTAVRGNVDKGEWAQALPEIEVFEADGVSIYVLHDLGQLDLKPEAAGFQVVVSGHSHVAKYENRNEVLFQSWQRRPAAFQVAGDCRQANRSERSLTRRDSRIEYSRLKLTAGC